MKGRKQPSVEYLLHKRRKKRRGFFEKDVLLREPPSEKGKERTLSKKAPRYGSHSIVQPPHAILKEQRTL